MLTNEHTDLLDFTLRTIPTEAMCDSGENAEIVLSAQQSRKKRRRDSSEALSETAEEFKSLVEVQRNAQRITTRTELLRQMRVILQMKRELTDGQEDERILLDEQLKQVKNELRE